MNSFGLKPEDKTVTPTVDNSNSAFSQPTFSNETDDERLNREVASITRNMQHNRIAESTEGGDCERMQMPEVEIDRPFIKPNIYDDVSSMQHTLEKPKIILRLKHIYATGRYEVIQPRCINRIAELKVSQQRDHSNDVLNICSEEDLLVGNCVGQKKSAILIEHLKLKSNGLCPVYCKPSVDRLNVFTNQPCKLQLPQMNWNDTACVRYA